ncbi:MAG: TonB-dependent receptor [Henriciella sp.]|jgi:outer membrane receptor protein involved in Fe transport
MIKLATTASLAALLAAGAVAQEINSADTDGEARQDTIIVTGQKIDRSLQDTPESVAVVTQVDIQTQNINDLSDAIARTANIATRFDDRGFSIRGISNENVSGAGFSDLATVYVDGAPISRDAVRGGPLSVWDIEQIEFLRGPQSTLQGRNALAGAIIINTAEPSYDWQGRARVVIGSGDEEKRFGAAIGGPILEDQVAFRLGGEVTETRGLVENTTLGGFDDENETLNLRGKLLIEPNAIPDLKIGLSYTHDDRKFGETIALFTVDNANDNRQIPSNRPYRDDTVYDLGVAKIDYEINDQFSISSITTLSELDRDRGGDTDRSALDLEFFDSTIATESFTQEFLLNYSGDRLEGVLGGYISQIDSEQFFESTFTFDVVSQANLGPTVAGLVTLQLVEAGFPLAAAQAQGQQTAAAVVPLYAGGFLINAVQQNPVEVETQAIFADFTYDLTDSVRLFGGFRYDTEEQTITTGNEVSILTPLPDPAAFPPIAAVLTQVNGLLVANALDATEEATTLQSPSFDAFLPKFGIGWDIDDKRSLNFIAQRGYRSGGVGINIATASSYTFDAEFTWNYEASFRSKWMDDRLTVNANAFFTDWSDQQVNVQLSSNTFDTETQNAGASEVMGLELETQYRASDNLDVYGSIGIAESDFTDFCATVSIAVTDGLETCEVDGATGFDFAGNTFVNAPDLTIAGGFTWQNQNWIVNGNANYASASFSQLARPQEQRTIDERTLVNFRAGWKNDNFGIYLTGDNIFDEEYLTSLFTFDPANNFNDPQFARFGRPQTFALQLEASF